MNWSYLIYLAQILFKSINTISVELDLEMTLTFVLTISTLNPNKYPIANNALAAIVCPKVTWVFFLFC